MDDKVVEKLQAPFPPESIEWRIGSTNKEKTHGMALAYITNRAIQDRLDEIFTPFGWKNEFREWKDKSQLCGISIWDDEKNEWVTKWDGAEDSNMEPTKGGLSDAMKRAAYQWGIGRYLYKLDAEWVPLKDGRMEKTPALPEWALPENYRSKPVTEAQVKELEELAERKKADKSQMLSYYKVEKFEDMTGEQYRHAVEYLNKKRRNPS